MGCIHLIACKKCKEKIELWQGDFLEPMKERPDLVTKDFEDLAKWVNPLWALRAFWFTWQHRDCGALVWDSEINPETFYSAYEDYKEIAPVKEKSRVKWD